MRREALIIGLGLIGGSAGIALRRRGWRVSYIDPAVSFEEAQRHGAADERVTAIRSADVIVIATPVDAAIRLLADIPADAGIVTSVCSVMKPLRDAARGTFVAGHPMAGSAERAITAARGDLFEGAAWFVDANDETVAQIVSDCGARLELVDAAEHDRAVALTSHLPQVLSTALAAVLAAHPDYARFAGSGLKTFLRLAGSDASVWQPVLDANHENIAAHADEVKRVVREIVEGDAAEAFASAQRFWRSL